MSMILTAVARFEKLHDLLSDLCMSVSCKFAIMCHPDLYLDCVPVVARHALVRIYVLVHLYAALLILSRVYQAWLGLEILQLSPTLREVPWLQPLEKQPGIVVTAALSELYQETEGAKQKMKKF